VPDDARIAVIGGGIAGCSLAYHLTVRGETDLVLLEQYELTSGTTWHAAGLCTQYSGSYNIGSLLRRSVQLYRSLEAETGLPVAYHRTGSLRLATSRDRLDELWHVKGVADQIGVAFEVVQPERVQALFPLLDPAGVVGAAHLPDDGWVDPASVAGALARSAQRRGARILRRARVTGLARDSRGWTLETTQGSLRAGTVVIAAGQWSPHVAGLAGLHLPIVPVEHQYVLTEPVAGLPPAHADALPVLRDPDGSFYVRQDGEGLLVGAFERDGRTWALGGIPRGFANRLLRPDLRRITPNLEAAERRVPVLAETPLHKTVNGPDGFTPDGRPLMGPLPGTRDLWVLAGFCFFGIVYSGGAGAYAADWLVDGQPSDSMWELDVRRFGDYARSVRYVAARALDGYAREYAIHFPEEERPAGRPLKTGPLYDRLLARGAVFGARFGWERPLWFARDGEQARDVYSFRRGSWFEAVGEECRAVRARVGVLDQTSFAKYEVSGPGAEAWLDRLCANRLPAVPGRMALTQALTPRGGIECDLTVTRLAADRFYLVSAAATQDHDRDWLERHLPENGSVRLDDVTGRYGVLTIAGPRSRDLLAALTTADVSREAFPFFTCRELEVAMAPVRALRVSYVGELGYELHHPLEYQRHLYEALLEAGGPLGLVDFGYRALESLRLEKAYRLWGADLSADWTPLQAGLGRFVAFDKGDFVGRDALLAQRERGLDRELACLVVDAPGLDCHGFEPVFDGSGGPIAYVTSGGFGHTLGLSLAFSYLPVEHAQPGTALSVELLGERYAARVVEQPAYDPRNERLLG
jgi:glycine cleavage system aminomethyltransferase T/glycine/D-amino acid oxidase-like deaminating enzyme